MAGQRGRHPTTSIAKGLPFRYSHNNAPSKSYQFPTIIHQVLHLPAEAFSSGLPSCHSLPKRAPSTITGRKVPCYPGGKGECLYQMAEALQCTGLKAYYRLHIIFDEMTFHNDQATSTDGLLQLTYHLRRDDFSNDHATSMEGSSLLVPPQNRPLSNNLRQKSPWI